MKKGKQQVQVAVISVVIVMVSLSCSCGKLSKSHNTEMKKEESHFDNSKSKKIFFDATIIAFDSVPAPNLKRVINDSIERKISIKINHDLQEKCAGVCLYEITKNNFIFNAICIDNEEKISFIVGYLLQDELFYKCIDDVIINDIISYKEDSLNYYFYGVCRYKNLFSKYYEFRIDLKSLRLWVTAVESFFIGKNPH